MASIDKSEIETLSNVFVHGIYGADSINKIVPINCNVIPDIVVVKNFNIVLDSTTTPSTSIGPLYIKCNEICKDEFLVVGTGTSINPVIHYPNLNTALNSITLQILLNDGTQLIISNSDLEFMIHLEFIKLKKSKTKKD